MIPMVKKTRKHDRNRGKLKKSRKVLAALVDAQLTVDEQRGLHLIKPTAYASKKFIYNAPNPKGKQAASCH